MNRTDFDQLPFLMALKRNQFEQMFEPCQNITPCCGADCMCDIPDNCNYTACRACGAYLHRIQRDLLWASKTVQFVPMCEDHICLRLTTEQLQQCANRLIEAGWK